MSKFLTPPVWYDSNGNLVEILTGGALNTGTTYTNSMAIGKNSSVAGNYSTAVGDHTNAYADNTIAIGCSAGSYAPGCIAIGSSATAAPDKGTIGSIAIGKGTLVCGDGSIAIGEGINLGSDTNPINYTIQIGAPDQTYSAQIGNGNGILKCRASEVAPISYKIDKQFYQDKLSISYPDGFIFKEHGIYGLVFTVGVKQGYQIVPVIFDGTKSSIASTDFNLSFGISENKKTIIYGNITWGDPSIIIGLDPLVTPDQTKIGVWLRYIVYLGSFQ